ncbi:MAG: phospho-N-acetylmuramoyl-pentapeptide-transferase [Brevinematales bacterium]|nr:phospho-N-acetylmuramoyl-pentapeptide-transferase [Brevinematales bacterium]
MLHLFFYQFRDNFILFNLLRYISFRSIAAFFTAFIIGMIIFPGFIRKLRERKMGQAIRDDGPQSHQTKAGTPTMGGLIVILAALTAVLLWVKFEYYVAVVSVSIVFFGAIGFIDDFLKVRYNNSKGISAKLKLALQLGTAAIILAMLYFNPQHWRENDFSLLIKNDQSKSVIEYPYTWQNAQPLEWKHTNSTGQLQPPGRYQFFFVVSDLFGNRDEHLLSIVRLFEDYGPVILDVHAVDIKPEEVESPKDSMLKLSWQIDLTEPVSETKSQQYSGIIEVKRSSDFFFSFYIPFFSQPVFVWPPILGFIFFAFVLIAFSNATNLSDGLDGLASGMGIILYIPFAIFSYVMGNILMSNYLLFPHLPGAGEMTVIIAAMIGGFAAFLWYNVHPAQIFMGDTLSLSMGGAIATIAIILKLELQLLIAGFVFVMETVSVVLQVFWFKRFKKRIFRMAPIHHHFELGGWKETQVVVRFYIISVLCALIALSALKIR